MFKDLSCCFEKENLTSFSSEELNVLERIENGKLRFVSIESAAVVKYPLAFLPKILDQKNSVTQRRGLFYGRIC